MCYRSMGGRMSKAPHRSEHSLLRWLEGVYEGPRVTGVLVSCERVITLERSMPMMKSSWTLMLALVFGATALWSVKTSFAGPPEWPECVTHGLTSGVIGKVIVDGQRYFVRRLANIFDTSLDDFGTSANADHHEIFCVTRTAADRFGKIAMCLSGERCPWRDPVVWSTA